MRNVSMKVLLFAAVMLGFAASYAASWPSSGPARKVTTLIICTNNKSPRLLAETIQSESKQPFILLPATQSDDTRIFFVPKKGQPAIELTEAKLAAFIRFLNPSRVVVLGNDNIVPRRYLQDLDRSIPLVTIDAEDWNRVAEELGSMLNLSAVPQDYKRLREDMFSDAKIYRPISKPAKAKVDIKDEPKLEEVAPVEAAADKTADKAAAPKADAPKADAPKADAAK